MLESPKRKKETAIFVWGFPIKQDRLIFQVNNVGYAETARNSIVRSSIFFFSPHSTRPGSRQKCYCTYLRHATATRQNIWRLTERHALVLLLCVCVCVCFLLKNAPSAGHSMVCPTAFRLYRTGNLDENQTFTYRIRLREPGRVLWGGKKKDGTP